MPPKPPSPNDPNDTTPSNEGEVYDGPDRRSGSRRQVERRKTAAGAKVEDRRAASERRKSPGRRKTDHDISEHRKVERRINEYPMTDEELEFIKAVNEYKQRYNKPFPTWSEILHILKSIGYEKKGR
ncbi:MAG: hypothetical protein ABFS86_02990 [Planctomycetota bacterium]